jgi:hypothetical protein
MKIATIPNARKVTPVPNEVKKLARRLSKHEIDISSAGLLFNADAWICTKWAHPHTDPLFANNYFLTVVMTDGYIIGDAGADPFEGDAGGPVRSIGDVLVIDSLTFHWCYPMYPLSRTPWVGLQWELPRRGAIQAARRIIGELGGEWVSRLDIDPRYEKWVP